MLCRRQIFAAAIPILICLNGCGSEASIVTVNDALERSVAPASAVEIQLETVGMYVDVTPSMEGFLHNFGSTNPTLYSLCLNELGILLTSKYDDITYYRVDTPLWRVDGPEDVLEQARDVSYYANSENFSGRGYTLIGDGDGYSSTCLTAALCHGTKENLFILVTDLYENSTGKNTNANTLAKQIRSLAGQDDGKVFGLIGIKSVFSGDVYDIGPDGKSDEYGKDRLSYRPFYILLRGYPEHVQDFCQSMETHLKELRAQAGANYEITVFYEEPFWPVDYSSFKGCANPITNSQKRKSLWLDDTVVNVKAAGKRADDVVLPVYGYRQNTAGVSGDVLYFTYSIERTHREQFRALAAKIGEETTVNFLPGGERAVYMLPCPARALSMSRWNEDNAAFAERTTALFEVCGLYYDRDKEQLHAALYLADERLTQGLWRLEWKNVRETSDAELNPWWQSWHASNADDYSKTAHLNDYIMPILEKASGTEQSILNAVAYLNIECGKAGGITLLPGK